MAEHVEVPVPEGDVEALAEMRWDEGRNPEADSPAWSELTHCEDLKRRYRDEARADLEELHPFLAPFIAAKAVEGVGESVRLAEEKGRREGRQQERERQQGALAAIFGCCQEVAAEVEDPTQACAEIEGIARKALDQEGDDPRALEEAQREAREESLGETRAERRADQEGDGDAT